MAKKSSGSGWDSDDDEPDDFALEPEDEDDWPDEPIQLPSWEDWFDYNWDEYDGEYEEYAVSADYGGEE